jgi:acyl-coenzyme A thioesterase PaaI-like protein
VSGEGVGGSGGSDASDASDGSGGDEAGVSWRIEGLRALELTPRRQEVRRLAAAMRDVIEHLVSTTATEAELTSAADQLEALAAVLRSLPRGQTYEGFSEAANAGEAMQEHRARAAGSAGRAPTWEEGDPERFAFFDHSPFIGLANPLSPPMTLDYDGDRVVGRVTFGAAYEGPPGCVHGGYVAAVFDELLGAAQSLSGAQGMTAHLGVDYRRPTPLATPLVLEAWLDRREGRKIWIRGTLTADGELKAEAEGLFIAFDPEKFRALLDARDEGRDPA